MDFIADLVEVQELVHFPVSKVVDVHVKYNDKNFAQ
jgi:hypothetical protein